MSNLKGILSRASGETDQGLQIQAMKIMTELALDASIKLPHNTKQNLIGRQLEIFIADGKAPGATLNRLKVTAGRMLVLLSTNCKTNSDDIRKEYDSILSRLTGLPDGMNSTFAHLAELIDPKNNNHTGK
jgi:hypothetical protein